MKIPQIAAAMAVVCLLGVASATSYYVDATGGDDAKDGQSMATAWKTIAKVNGSSFVAGDQILFKRGEVWRERLAPPSNGAAGNTIKFDAYGMGEAPTLTGYLDLPAAGWTLDSGNIWKTPVTASSMTYVLFGGSVWGQKHTSSKGQCVAAYDFFFMSNMLYVYSPGNPATYYGSIAALLTASGLTLIDINNRSYLEVQHFKLTYFDYYGVQIRGSSDHITVANVYAEGIIPGGMLPHGFYVNASPAPTDINFYNVDAHRNADGFRFSGTAGLIRLKNCRAYANRDRGLEDDTGAANYSYCHFYANNIAILDSTDVTGGVDGGNNITTDTWPAPPMYARYPARITFTVDDIGFAGVDQYVDSLIPLFEARGLKISVAVMAAYSSGIVGKLQNWLSAGHDLNSHSWSHQYYSNTNAFSLQYTGSGTAATVTITGNHLTTAVTGGPGGENLNFDLGNASYDTLSELIVTINSRGVYTANLDVNAQGAVHSIALADVSAHDIKAAYMTLLEKDRLVPDEMATSKAWLQANVSGLSNVKVYVYPGGYEDTSTQGWAVAAGYEGARGGMSMNLGLKEVYGMGVNIQDITSLGMAGATGLAGQTAAQMDARIAALVFKSSVWGVPYGFFCHEGELTTTEVGIVLDSLLAHGAVLMTNTQLMEWLHSQPPAGVSGVTDYVTPASGGSPDFRPTALSPVVNWGADMGANYKFDVAGVDQSWMGSGWEMGAYAYVPSGTYVVVVH